MEGESGVTRSFIVELRSSDIQGDQMQGESGVTRSIIDELPSWYIQRDLMEGESGVTRRFTHELHSWDIQGDQTEGESGVTRSTLMKLILPISKEINWKVKVVLVDVSLMDFILRISDGIE